LPQFSPNFLGGFKIIGFGSWDFGSCLNQPPTLFLRDTAAGRIVMYRGACEPEFLGLSLHLQRLLPVFWHFRINSMQLSPPLGSATQ
jgi:hypothetical protein